MTKKSMMDNRIVYLSLIFVLIAGSTLSVVYIDEFIGFATLVSSQAGYITKILIEQTNPTLNWQGYYGLQLMLAGYTVIQTDDAAPGGLEEKIWVFDCLEPNIEHELYASLVLPSSLSYNTVTAAVPEGVDAIFGITPSEHDSVTNTFLFTDHIVIGGTNYSGLPAAYTLVSGNTTNTTFATVLINASGDIVFGTRKIEDPIAGYNTQEVHYQLMIPAAATTTYYFSRDPNDNCPAGFGSGFLGDGFVTGYVYDTKNNLPLGNVTLGVGGSTNITETDGFFNITAPVGYQYLVAIKDNYFTNTTLVNITFGLSTEQNISMELILPNVDNGTIRGLVTDNQTGAVLENVTISAGGKSALTNSTGWYNSSALEGNHTFTAIFDGYEPFISYINITANIINYLNVSLQPVIGIVEGYAIDNSTSLVVGNVTVAIGDETTLTNASGQYRLYVRGGEHYLVGVADGYDNYATNVTVVGGQELEHNLTLIVRPTGAGSFFQNGSVHGYVMDSSDGSLLANATVTLNGVRFVTNASGFYNVSVIQGTHNIFSQRDDYENYIAEINVTPANDTLVNISMDPFLVRNGENGTLLGNVTNSIGSGLENATISIAGRTTQSNLTGAYIMTVVEGEHNIIATRDGYATYFNTLNITAANETIHNIVMNTTPDDGTASGTAAGTTAGGGAGGASGDGDAKKVKIVTEGQEETDYDVSITEIIKKLRVGAFLNVPVTITNYRKGAITVRLEVEGEVGGMIRLDKETLNIDASDKGSFTVTLLGNQEPGIYEGTLKISGDIEDEIPIYVLLYDRDKLPIEALLIRLETNDPVVYLGEWLRYKITIQNLLREEEYDVALNYKLRDETTGEETELDSDNVSVQTSFSLLKSWKVPLDFKKGEYTLVVESQYLDFKSEHVAIFNITEPFYMYAIFGVIPLWWLLVGLLGFGFLAFLWLLYKKHKASKQRYKIAVDMNELPKKGPRSIYVGHVAETTKETYFDLDKFQIHTLVAGASGSGKSAAAQTMAEEALAKNCAVLVFDPTANWTGFLRKNQDKDLLNLFPTFNMKKSEAKAYNGNVHLIKDGNQLIRFRKYMKPGEINILVTSDLDTDQTERMVSNLIKDIFHAELPEEPQCKYLIVYDGIHTLLPKFGGSGKVFIQIERATREFRKWGVGLVLVSQVLSDFPPQVLANINTEIQMRTRDEGDLKRVKEEYGDALVKGLVKASVGAGMVENAAYNKGKPYFIQYKPVRHSLDRLKPEELENYAKYNLMVDELQDQIEQLKKEEADVFDLELELKLATDKVKAGSFNMVDIYLEGLKPRVAAVWEKVGKKPKPYHVEIAPPDEDEAEEIVKEEEKKAEAAPAGNAPAPPASGDAAPPAEEKPAAPSEPEMSEAVQNIMILIEGAKIAIANGGIGPATGAYQLVMNMYKTLGEEDKKQVIGECQELGKKLSQLQQSGEAAASTVVAAKPQPVDETDDEESAAFNQVAALLEKAFEAADAGNKDEAKKIYAQVMPLYKTLTPEERKRMFPACAELQKQIN